MRKCSRVHFDRSGFCHPDELWALAKRAEPFNVAQNDEFSAAKVWVPGQCICRNMNTEKHIGNEFGRRSGFAAALSLWRACHRMRMERDKSKHEFSGGGSVMREAMRTRTSLRRGPPKHVI